MIDRIWETAIKERYFKKKAILVLGPRQVGKTTLLKKAIQGLDGTLWLNADTIEVRQLLEKPSAARFRSIIGKNRIVVIDEAQQIADIGLKLKIMVDEMPGVQFLATGSAAFDLANSTKEPLTGRKYEFQLYPLSFQEMAAHHGLFNEIQALGTRMVFGYYPDVVVNQGDEKEILGLLADSYLYKDILIWNRIKKADKIVTLLRALAYQIGNQVSYNELGRLCGLDSETVEKYIILLEKAFVIYRLGSFSRNLRTELRKSRKIYFVDNGVRNAVIGNYNP